MSRRSTSDDYMKGSRLYRDEDDADENQKCRDRSPLRTDDTRESTKKFAFGLGKRPEQKKGIQIKLGATSKQPVKPAAIQKPSVASVFDPEEDDEPEEMPAEARMRMRNIGRETPTSAGPNSFGKTKQGFCDSKKIFEKTLKKAMDEANK